MSKLEREKRDRLLSLLLDIRCWLSAHEEPLRAIRTTHHVAERVNHALEDNGWLKGEEVTIGG